MSFDDKVELIFENKSPISSQQSTIQKKFWREKLMYSLFSGGKKIWKSTIRVMISELNQSTCRMTYDVHFTQGRWNEFYLGV